MVSNQENRLWRTLTAKQGEYRQRLLKILAERMRQPAAQVSLALVGTLILIAILGGLVIRPTMSTISSLIKEIGDEQKLIAALDDKFRALVTAEGLMAEMKQDLPRIDWAIPNNQEFEMFAKEAEILAKEIGLTAIEISQSGFRLTGGDNETVGENLVEVRLSVGGSEAAVREFLADLVKMDRLVVVKSVNVSSVPKDRRQNEPYQVRAAIGMEIMYY